MCEQTTVGGNIAHFRGQTADYQGGHNVEFLRDHGATFWLQDKGLTRSNYGGPRPWKDPETLSWEH